MSERKLASVRRIAEIKPIEGADAIEAARVDGWWVVTKKGEFNVGDLAVYFEIDSWIPEGVAPFLFKGREFGGVKGERLRTVKLRGQVSQGLLLPLEPTCHMIEFVLSEGLDVTAPLNIQKWEKPVPVQLQGQMRGNFPSFIRKTDQERIQNRLDVLDSDALWEVTVKLDGSSMTVYWHEGVMGVCSRNLDLKMEQEGNTFVDTAKRVFKDWKPKQQGNYAIQGELMGPGIQGNREGLNRHEFFVFDIWDIDEQKYLTPEDRCEFCAENALCHVPVLHYELPITGRTLEDMLALADATQSINHPTAEGIVFKRADGGDSFKVISNKFLLKEKD